MVNYVLTNKAVEDISEIWNYMYEVWSENRANHYYQLLIEACKEIAEKPTIGKVYENISNETLGFGVGKHIIFYRELVNKSIEIVRILHERMDLKNRIKG